MELVHGPGCPVCVTPLEMVDRRFASRSLPGVIFTSYGDMLRVPGSRVGDLFGQSEGRRCARGVFAHGCAENRAGESGPPVVFFGVGFETTAPANAMAVWQARREGLSNFSMLVSHVLVPPAMSLILRRRPTGCRDSSPPATSAR